jgi:hypothetical protein
VPPRRKPGIQLAWTTVTYRSVLLSLLLLSVAFATVLHFAFPQLTDNGVKAATGLANRILERIAGVQDVVDAAPPGTAKQAHFTNLDGTVRVKKANSNTWVNADYNVPLEKGDVVQTSSEGMAKIVFNDGTNYTVKQDSLIVIEENSANDNQTTNVAVTVSTGTVDLSTGMYLQGSKSQVNVGGATASFAPDSSARVKTDARADQNEIMVTRGAGEVVRNGEAVRLGSFEKVSYQKESPRMAKVKEVGPPTPISPANMMPIFTSANPRPVEFSWTAMSNAAGYRLRISRNPYFSSLVLDRKIEKPVVQIAGLTEGAYYWVVQSYDAENKESIESEKNRFTIIPKGKEQAAIPLEIEPFIQHGHVIEVRGKTEANARVMVNGREVPLLGSDGTFRYFTPPLPNGESLITVTAQNSHGGVNTRQKTVVIQ